MNKKYFLLLLSYSIFSKAQSNAIVHIPDTAFKDKLLSFTEINSNGDLEIQLSEAESFNGELDINSTGIYDLTGIEAFTNLNFLDCSRNHLTSIDISKNTALTTLYCYDNQLTSLDVSKNSVLDFLKCSDNQLTSLDVSKNTKLTRLYCFNNKITSLDTSNNTILERLSCSNNQLTRLDISNCSALIALKCYENQLTSIDISDSSALIILKCYANQLTSLDVSNATALKLLNCSGNQLMRLDVSKNTELIRLNCSANQLSSLNLKNGNNIDIETMVAYDNENLACIQVDDENYEYLSCFFDEGWCKDNTAIYSENCATASIVDTEFNDHVSIFPNPVSDILTVHYSEFGTLKSVTLYSAILKTITETNSHTLDFNDLPVGMYFLKIENTENKITVKKIIKN